MENDKGNLNLVSCFKDHIYEFTDEEKIYYTLSKAVKEGIELVLKVKNKEAIYKNTFLFEDLRKIFLFKFAKTNDDLLQIIDKCIRDKCAILNYCIGYHLKLFDQVKNVCIIASFYLKQIESDNMISTLCHTMLSQQGEINEIKTLITKLVDSKIYIHNIKEIYKST
jgi:hypothetical protein